MLYFGGGFSINEQRNNACLCIQKTLKHGRKMLDEYFRQYGVIAVFAALAVAVPTGMLLVSWFLSVLGIRPKNPSSVKNSIYECGFETITEKWSNFNFRYYSIALLFVIFDVEVIFLFLSLIHI